MRVIWLKTHRLNPENDSVQHSTENKSTVAISINGQQRSFEDPISIEQMLVELHISNPAIAVEVNNELVPRAAFSCTFLKKDDRVEIVSLFGGG